MLPLFLLEEEEGRLGGGGIVVSFIWRLVDIVMSLGSKSMVSLSLRGELGSVQQEVVGEGRPGLVVLFVVYREGR